MDETTPKFLSVHLIHLNYSITFWPLRSDFDTSNRGAEHKISKYLIRKINLIITSIQLSYQ